MYLLYLDESGFSWLVVNDEIQSGFRIESALTTQLAGAKCTYNRLPRIQMKINPFHSRFGLTKRSIKYRHSLARRGLKKYGVNNKVSIASFADHHTDLHKLCQKHGTDKGHTDITTHDFGKRRGYTHDYASAYDLLFSQSRNNIRHLLECGIATLDRRDGINPKDSDENSLGPSLRMWREYFPNATITGIDIDEHCMFTDERIETYQCDQTDPQSIDQFLNQIPDRKFDIVIDDGLHKYHAGITLFENVIDRLRHLCY